METEHVDFTDQVLRQFDGKSKITDFCGAILNQNVPHGQIGMDDMVLLQNGESTGDLPGV